MFLIHLMSTFHAVKMTNNGSFKKRYDKNEKAKTPQAPFCRVFVEVSQVLFLLGSSQCHLNSVLMCGKSIIQRYAKSRVFSLGALVSCHR